MEQDPLMSLVLDILPENTDKADAIAADALEVLRGLVRVTAEIIESEPGLLDLYVFLAKSNQYPLIIRGGLPVRDPIRLIDIAGQALVPLARHGFYDEVATLMRIVNHEPLLVYDSTRLYALGRLEDVRNMATRYGVEPWALEYTALIVLASLTRGLLSLIKHRVQLAPLNNKCPLCGRELVNDVCPLCGQLPMGNS